MYETIQGFLAMVDDEERKSNPAVNRRVYFLEKMQERDENGLPSYRLGQAFMNALRGSEYYEKLSGSPYDCFYKNMKRDVEETIDFLCRKGPLE